MCSTYCLQNFPRDEALFSPEFPRVKWKSRKLQAFCQKSMSSTPFSGFFSGEYIVQILGHWHFKMEEGFKPGEFCSLLLHFLPIASFKWLYWGSLEEASFKTWYKNQSSCKISLIEAVWKLHRPIIKKIQNNLLYVILLLALAKYYWSLLKRLLN